ncbi:hypothetical protein LCGC14_1774320 [marine sediment metagenome]|uniref:CMP/dCMP-type deaminase domain-containing protein n=1 Tax=marine sediment metagenome TaxID=412755 RepID=A0A0F9GX88_9ZZZZ
MYYKVAIEQAKKSQYKKRVGAIVVYKGNIVGKGYNKVHSTGVPRLDGKHAELEALGNTTAKYRKGSTVYVCRLTRSGHIAMSKPCPACTVVMKKIGVKYVWYSSSDDTWEKLCFHI